VLAGISLQIGKVTYQMYYYFNCYKHNYFFFVPLHKGQKANNLVEISFSQTSSWPFASLCPLDIFRGYKLLSLDQ